MPSHLLRPPFRVSSRRSMAGPRLALVSLESREVPATFTVTNLGDNGGADPAPGAGTGTLRQAIVDANDSGGADIIDATGVTGTITLQNALPSMNDGVELTGSGEASLIVSGANLFRVLDTGIAAPFTPFKFSKLTLADGGGTDGGGLFINDEAVTLENVTVRNNTVTGNGGGIFLQTGTASLTATGSTIRDNRSNALGAGILMGGNSNVTLTNTTVSGNTTSKAGGFGGGGAGLYFYFGGFLTVTNCTITGNSSPGLGGAIYFYGGTSTFNITNTTFSGNQGGNGGAIGINNFGTSEAKLTGSTLAANTAAGSGGALAFFGASGRISLSQSTVRDNFANDNGGGFAFGGGSPTLSVFESTLSGNSSSDDGGAVYFFDGGSLIVDHSTVSGNTASGPDGGGGIYFWGTVGADGFSVRNSTISGNSAAANGGGLLLNSSDNLFNIQNSTITDNTGGNGGGVTTRFTTGMNVAITSTIISGNTGPGATADVGMGGGFATASFSAVGVDPASTGFTYDATNLPFGTVLNLGTLLNNGGLTKTHALNTGSPAINAGTNLDPSINTTDQRGGTFARDVGQTDIGAFEVQSAAPVTVTSVIVNGSPLPDFQRSRLTTIDVTFSAPVNAASLQAANAIMLVLTTPGSGGTAGTVVTVGSGLLVSPASGSVTTIALTFENISLPGAIDSASLADGRWQLSIPSASGYLSPLDDPYFRRLFGDFNNDGTVDGGVDFPAFGAEFNSTGANLAFDFNNDGIVEGAIDFPAFGARYNSTL